VFFRTLASPDGLPGLSGRKKIFIEFVYRVQVTLDGDTATSRRVSQLRQRDFSNRMEQTKETNSSKVEVQIF
jgi:hypothetical protein